MEGAANAANPQAGFVLAPEDRAWLDGLKPDLVERAEKFLVDNKIFKAKSPGNKQPLVSGSQLRNLLAAAQSGSPLAVLANFLRYQIGRGGRGWTDMSSGEALVLHLDPKGKSLDKKPSLAVLCKEQVGQRDSPCLYQLEAQVAAQFLGFLIRDFTYRCKLEGTQPT